MLATCEVDYFNKILSIISNVTIWMKRIIETKRYLCKKMLINLFFSQTKQIVTWHMKSTIKRVIYSRLTTDNSQVVLPLHLENVASWME